MHVCKIDDLKALNRDYGAVNVASTKELKKLVNALVQQQHNRDKSDDACNNCGKKGHWHRECPELNGNKKFNSRNKSARNNPGRREQKKGNPYT